MDIDYVKWEWLLLPIAKYLFLDILPNVECYKNNRGNCCKHLFNQWSFKGKTTEMMKISPMIQNSNKNMQSLLLLLQLLPEEGLLLVMAPYARRQW